MPNTVTLRQGYNFIGFQPDRYSICQWTVAMVIDQTQQLGFGLSRDG